jgi:uncharacterized protein (DUF433 family)
MHKSSPSIPQSSSNGSRIIKTPKVCGGRARVDGTRVPVWGIEHARMTGYSIQQIVKMFPSLDEADVSAAFSYADIHRKEIEQEIRDNEEA